MLEFELNGRNYRSGALNTFAQLHVSRKLAPTLIGLMSVAQAAGTADASPTLEAALKPIVTALSAMSDEDVEYVVGKCLACVKTQQGESWFPIWNTGSKVMMYDDILLPQVLQIVARVVQDNLGGFMPALPDLKPQA